MALSEFDEMVVVRRRDTVKGLWLFYWGLYVHRGLRGDGEEGLMVRSWGEVGGEGRDDGVLIWLAVKGRIRIWMT